MQLDRSTAATAFRYTLSTIFPFSIMLLGTLTAATHGYACSNVSDALFAEKDGDTGPLHIVRQSDSGVRNSPNVAVKAIANVASAFNDLQARVLTGPLLERLIVESRNAVIGGSLPIPPCIRQQLTGYASEDSMDRVRYKVGNGDAFNLAQPIVEAGFADAVTLIDVIVFRRASAAANASAWAHELTHVDQFRDWGVEGFAVRYARNWRDVESPAYDKSDGFGKWQQSRRERTPTERNAAPIECSPGAIGDQ